MAFVAVSETSTTAASAVALHTTAACFVQGHHFSTGATGAQPKLPDIQRLELASIMTHLGAPSRINAPTDGNEQP